MINNEPLISIVIPTYNRSSDLKRALNSVVSQTYQDFEVIIVDNHSSDDTDRMILEFKDSRIRLLKIHNNGIIAASRNLGVRSAFGTFIAFLDSDDWWYENKLYEVSKYFDRSDVIYHNLDVYSKNKKINKRRLGKKFKNPKLDLILNGNSIPNSSVSIRKSFLLEIDYIKEDLNLVSLEDYDMLLRLAYINCRFEFINKTLGAYSWENDNHNISYSDQIIVKLKYLIVLHINNFPKNLHNEIIFRLKYRLGRYSLLFKNNSKALEYFISSLRSSSFKFKIKSIINIFYIFFLYTYFYTYRFIILITFLYKIYLIKLVASFTKHQIDKK